MTRSSRIARRTLGALLLAGVAAAVPTRLVAQAGEPPKPPKLPVTSKVPTTYEGIFEERDKRAVAVIGYLRCMEVTLAASQAGVFGTVPASWQLVCMQQGTEWRGVYAELSQTTPRADVRAQFALRGRGLVVNDAVDTTVVSAIARAQRRAFTAPLPGRGVADFTPVVLAQPTFVEIWFLPVPGRNRVVVGGDSIIQMVKDGGRELGHANSTPPVRTLPFPSGAQTPLVIESADPRAPLVSELLAAREALAQVPEVRVRAAGYESVLTRGARTWVHARRSGANAP